MCNFLQKILKICLVFALILLPESGFALPQGESIVSGSAVFNDLGTTLEINQSTDKLIVEYDSFSIASNETVDFNQPSISSKALNRVIGSDPSKIFGTLTSNGTVFLVNPSGVLFGSTANVDVGGLVASTLNITDVDFLNDNFVFTGNQGSIKNYGKLRANRVGGYIALLSPELKNTGLIKAVSLGKIALASGEKVTLGLDDYGLISVVVNKKVTSNASGADAAIDNQGTLYAPAGEIVLTAQVLDTVFDEAINNSGIIEASTMRGHKGKVALLANHDIGVTGEIEGSAMVDISSTGDIDLDGADVVSDDTIFLTSQDGSITQSSGLISSQNLALSAKSGINLDSTSVDKLSALNTDWNDIVIVNDKDLQIADLTGLSGINPGVVGQAGIVNTAFGGAIDLTVLGNLSVNEMIQTLRGDIALAATGNIIQNGNGDIEITGNDTPWMVPNPINLDSPSHTPGVRSLDNTVDVTWQVEDPVYYEVSPANFQASAGGDYIMNAGTKVETHNGDATVKAEGDVKLALIDASMGNVSVTSVNGSILDNDLGVIPGDYDVIGHTIKLSADNGSIGGPGAEEEIDMGHPYDFSFLWIENEYASVDGVLDPGYTSSLDSNGEWVFAQTSDPLADSDNWWFHVATIAGEMMSEQASIGPFVIGSETPPPNPDTRGYGDEYQDENPVYYEILAPSQFLNFEPATTLGLYAYHPLTPVDQSAFDDIRLDADAYEFIEDNIRKKGNFSSYFGE